MDLNNILELENRVAENPQSPLAVRLSDYYLESRVKIHEAINLCKNVLHAHPDYQAAYYVLAKCYLVEKNYQAAGTLIQLAKKRFFEQSVANSLSALIYEIIGEDGFKKNFLSNNEDMIFSHIQDDEFDFIRPSTNIIIEKPEGSFSPLTDKPAQPGGSDSSAEVTLDMQELSNIDSLVEKHKRSFLQDLNSTETIPPHVLEEMPIQDIPQINTIIEKNKDNFIPKAVVESPVIKEVITNDIYLNHTKKESVFFDEEYITKEDFERLKKKDEDLNEIKSEIFNIPQNTQIDSRLPGIDKELIIDDLLNEDQIPKTGDNNNGEEEKSEIFSPGLHPDFSMENIKSVNALIPDMELTPKNKVPVVDVNGTPPSKEEIILLKDQKPSLEKFDLLNEIAKLNGRDANKDLVTKDIPKKSELSVEEVSSKIKQGELPEKFINKTLAQIYESQGKYEEAVEVYNQLFLNEKITVTEYEEKMIEMKEKLYKLNPEDSDLLI